jgi:PAS domain-containing protein
LKTLSAADSALLRQRAEALLQARLGAANLNTPAIDLLRLQHELEVHQIELQMQNEELRQAHVETEAALAKYTELYDFAPTGYYTLDHEGIIRSVNLTGARLLHSERARLLGRHFALQVLARDRLCFNECLKKAFRDNERESCEVTLPGETDSPPIVRIEIVASTDGRECHAAVMDVTARHHEALERERLILELQQAATEVKVLSGLLPIHYTPPAPPR